MEPTKRVLKTKLIQFYITLNEQSMELIYKNLFTVVCTYKHYQGISIYNSAYCYLGGVLPNLRKFIGWKQ